MQHRQSSGSYNLLRHDLCCKECFRLLDLASEWQAEGDLALIKTSLVLLSNQFVLMVTAQHLNREERSVSKPGHLQLASISQITNNHLSFSLDLKSVYLVKQHKKQIRMECKVHDF